MSDSIFLLCGLAFALAGFTFFTAILIGRTPNTFRKRKYEALQEEFQKTINALIIRENHKNDLRYFSLESYLKDLRYKIRSSFAKQLLIDLLIANKQNLKGDSATVLKEVYSQLPLKRHSYRKLHKLSLIKKIQGLQELAEMECHDMLPAIQELLDHRKVVIQQESFIATVRLASESPFVLVDHFTSPITPWMEVAIQKHLNSIPAERIPKFWRWFYSANKEIKKFAITMARQFRQLESIPHLEALLGDLDIELAGMAAELLGEWGAVQYADAIVNLGNVHPGHEALSLKVIAAMAQIGNGEAHGVFLASYMNYGSHNVRIGAINAMQDLHLNCRDFLIDHEGFHVEEFEMIYAHVNDPLLRK
ncbi:MAG TPA: hypothetical protein VK666_14430 [Chryseolinea sp.]|nr:hypothetical protein [Chryseolinea sp.]